jgi:hypothetical protein
LCLWSSRYLRWESKTNWKRQKSVSCGDVPGIPVPALKNFSTLPVCGSEAEGKTASWRSENEPFFATAED